MQGLIALKLGRVVSRDVHGYLIATWIEYYCMSLRVGQVRKSVWKISSILMDGPDGHACENPR